MNTHILIVLSRRLDAPRVEMESAWDAYKDDRGDDAKLQRFTRSLRRANRLQQSIKAHS